MNIKTEAENSSSEQKRLNHADVIVSVKLQASRTCQLRHCQVSRHLLSTSQCRLQYCHYIDERHSYAMTSVRCDNCTSHQFNCSWLHSVISFTSCRSVALSCFFSVICLLCFYARKQLLLSARPSHSQLCLSVCPSHGWISQKRCKLGSPNLHRRLPGRSSFRNRKAFP